MTHSALRRCFLYALCFSLLCGWCNAAGIPSHQSLNDDRNDILQLTHDLFRFDLEDIRDTHLALNELDSEVIASYMEDDGVPVKNSPPLLHYKIRSVVRNVSDISKDIVFRVPVFGDPVQLGSPRGGKKVAVVVLTGEGTNLDDINEDPEISQSYIIPYSCILALFRKQSQVIIATEIAKDSILDALLAKMRASGGNFAVCFQSRHTRDSSLRKPAPPFPSSFIAQHLFSG